ncbi:hypothetical protein QDR37_09915 [Amnibacterium sp. CER49]|uniref:hypothetical protein n=1 Tax=Amnibacterium sp. CER49 TaxID=3039161 RepID=UPI0024486E60|nr:hypothetical protein [Amnibacterium sp. CER49]MDH2444260.1 hypothetical protein [Amnibacterium sp. CER49]
MSEEPMRDDLPTEERLDRIERAVLSRIRLEEDARLRRRRRLVGGGMGLALAAAVVGLVVVVHPVGQSGASSGSAAGGSAYSGPSSASGGNTADSSGGGAPAVVCHAGATTTSPSAKATATDPTPVRLADACAKALGPEAAPRTTSTPTTAGLPGPAVCRDRAGVLHVFLTDSPARRVCPANGMTPR